MYGHYHQIQSNLPPPQEYRRLAINLRDLPPEGDVKRPCLLASLRVAVVEVECNMEEAARTKSNLLFIRVDREW
jgi:hypothetical protein